MKSFEREFIEKLTIPNKTISVIRLIGEFKGKQDLYKQQSPQILENLRQVAIINSVESSNRLEGIIATPKRMQAIVKENAKPENRTEGEIAGYRDVLNTVHSSYEDIPFIDSIVLQLHRDLMKYTASGGGKWKVSQNLIQEKRSDGSDFIRFIPVEPFKTAEYMNKLHSLYKSSFEEIDPLISIPLYVLDFLCIHPFSDGNGRMARLLTALLLYQNGYEVSRYISLEKIIESSKESYYDTLYKSSQGWHEGQHNSIYWIDYWLSTVLAAYREFEERAGKQIDAKGSKTRMVIDAIEGFKGEFSTSQLEEICPLVSHATIRKVLNTLKKEQKIELLTKGQNAKWRKTL